MWILNPIYDRVVCEFPASEEEVRASGLIVPTFAQKKSSLAKVVAAGPGAYQSGVMVKTVVKPGDWVVLGSYSGSEVTVNDKKYTIMREQEILAVAYQVTSGEIVDFVKKEEICSDSYSDMDAPEYYKGLNK